MSALAAALVRRLPDPRPRIPPRDSLAFYAVLAVVGVAEVVEWPAVLLTATAQALLDHRAAKLEAQLSVQPAPSEPSVS